jgi:excisionase family DNA binding protein
MHAIPFTSDDKPEPLLTAEDLMRALQLSRAQVYAMLASGEIPSLRIGRLRRVTRKQLEAFIASRTEGAA